MFKFRSIRLHTHKSTPSYQPKRNEWTYPLKILYKNVQSSFICKSQTGETSQMPLVEC